MRTLIGLLALSLPVTFGACDDADLKACLEQIASGRQPRATTRDQRFEGKVREVAAQCRGGEKALGLLNVPWLDWPNYYGVGDASSRSSTSDDRRGVFGALVDIELERLDLIKLNLFDNTGTFKDYIVGRPGTEGPAIKTWPELRLPPNHPNYADVGAAGAQLCRGTLIRGRTLSGICNDIENPLMGSTGMPLGRNVEFESTFPDRGLNEDSRNRHQDRLSLMTPDPQVISRTLFTRPQSDPAACADGSGKPDFSTVPCAAPPQPADQSGRPGQRLDGDTGVEPQHRNRGDVVPGRSGIGERIGRPRQLRHGRFDRDHSSDRRGPWNVLRSGAREECVRRERCFQRSGGCGSLI